MFLTTKSKKILVIGGSGFIGRAFLQTYAPKYKTYFTYHKNEFKTANAWGWRLSLNSEIHMCHILSELRPDIVIHAAGLTSVKKCEQDWQWTYDINVRGTHDLVNLCRDINARIIYLSTDFVFDGNRGNYEETDDPFPQTRYGRSKLMAEEIVYGGSSSSNTVLRLSLVYGFGTPQAPGMIGWLQDALIAGRPLHLFTDEIRTPVYIDDVLGILNEVVENTTPGIFHIGGREKINRYDFGLRFANTLGYNPNCIIPASIKDYHEKPPRPEDLSLNIGRAQKRFKTILAGVDDGLRRMREIQTRNDQEGIETHPSSESNPEPTIS